MLDKNGKLSLLVYKHCHSLFKWEFMEKKNTKIQYNKVQGVGGCLCIIHFLPLAFPSVYIIYR